MNNSAHTRALTIPERARDAAVTAGQQLMSGLEGWLLRSSEIPTTPFLDGGDFPWAETPYRGVVRCHLGLLVPGLPDECGIGVGGEVRHWREGETMFFDDGYEHFAWNDTDDTRVVQFLDVIRPLRRPAADVNKALLRAIAWSPFLWDAKRRHEAWERRFERLAR
jgi:ornithine lipid ester-linked acyl 2-hydroxylase